MASFRDTSSDDNTDFEIETTPSATSSSSLSISDRLDGTDYEEEDDGDDLERMDHDHDDDNESFIKEIALHRFSAYPSNGSPKTEALYLKILQEVRKEQSFKVHEETDKEEDHDDELEDEYNDDDNDGRRHGYVEDYGDKDLNQHQLDMEKSLVVAGSTREMSDLSQHQDPRREVRKRRRRSRIMVAAAFLLTAVVVFLVVFFVLREVTNDKDNSSESNNQDVSPTSPSAAATLSPTTETAAPTPIPVTSITTTATHQLVIPNGQQLTEDVKSLYGPKLIAANNALVQQVYRESAVLDGGNNGTGPVIEVRGRTRTRTRILQQVHSVQVNSTIANWVEYECPPLEFIGENDLCVEVTMSLTVEAEDGEVIEIDTTAFDDAIQNATRSCGLEDQFSTSQSAESSGAIVCNATLFEAVMPSSEPSQMPSDGGLEGGLFSDEPSMVPSDNSGSFEAPSLGPSMQLLPSPAPSDSPSVSTDAPIAPSTSVSPTQSNRPTAPTVSPFPSISSSPSFSPTLSHSPSQSVEPSDLPSASMQPTLSANPSTTPSVIMEEGRLESSVPSSQPSSPTLSPRPPISSVPSGSPSLTPRPSLSFIPSELPSLLSAGSSDFPSTGPSSTTEKCLLSTCSKSSPLSVRDNYCNVDGDCVAFGRCVACGAQDECEDNQPCRIDDDCPTFSGPGFCEERPDQIQGPKGECVLLAADSSPVLDPDSRADGVISFVVMADTPYDIEQRYCLNEQLRDLPAIRREDVNQNGPAFVVHLGDIKNGEEACSEAAYNDVADIFSNSENRGQRYDPADVFFVIGDNEYQDCPDITAEEALQRWSNVFGQDGAFGKSYADIVRQDVRRENFAFTVTEATMRMLVVGLNLVGSDPTADEAQRYADNIAWVQDRLEAATSDGNTLSGLVVVGHADLHGNRKSFGAEFRSLLRNSYADLTTLYLHGDAHAFCSRFDPANENANLLVVQTDAGGDAPPMTVSLGKRKSDGKPVFAVERNLSRYVDRGASCPSNESFRVQTWGGIDI